MNLVDVVGGAEGLQLGRLLGREIGDDQPIDAGVDSIAHEVWQAVLEERVEVAHQHERRLDAVRPELPDGVDARLDGDTLLQGVKARLLDGGTIGDGIAEGDTDFQQVAAVPQDGLGDLDGGRNVGESDRDVGGKDGPALGAGIAERLVESI